MERSPTDAQVQASKRGAEYEKIPFEVTPFLLYLTRQGDHSPTEALGAYQPSQIQIQIHSRLKRKSPLAADVLRIAGVLRVEQRRADPF